jgi:hypothetical protein
MRLSFRARQAALREAHLAREEEMYASMEHAEFRKVKEWDERGPTVIWEGTLCHPDLSQPYKIQIHYGPAYPFIRPDVYPVEPKILNQRHQNPSAGRDKTPGSLCLFPHAPDRWSVGMTCPEIVERVVCWLKAYETDTLNDEFAPPEIERFFPSAHRLDSPAVMLVDDLLADGGAEEGGCRLIPTASGGFAFLALLPEGADAEALDREVKRITSMILPCEDLNVSGAQRGEWFSLEKEPELPVPLSSADLMRLLKRSGRPMSKIRAFAREKPSAIAVRYPTPAGPHWLVFRTSFVNPSTDGFRPRNIHHKILAVNQLQPLLLYTTYRVSKETIFSRVSGFEVEELASKKCLVLGCGSVGSRVAETLIKTGVGGMTLVDNDKVRAGNVSRHVLGLDSLGENKAERLRQRLLNVNPFAVVEAFGDNLVLNPETFEGMVTRADLVVSCLGSDAAELYVNAACAAQGKPALFCRSYLQGRLGEAFLFRPPQHSACFGCASAFLGTSDCPVPRPPEVPYRDLIGFDGDCGSAFIPASAVDLDLVSLHGARLALALLQGIGVRGNYWLVRGREFASGEYPTLTGDIREPFRQHVYEIPRDETCEVCRED